MCSIANLFNTSIRKLDAKKTNFFCPEYLDCVNQAKSIFFNKNKINVLGLELWTEN